MSLSEVVGPLIPPDEFPRSRSKALVLEPAFKFPDPAEFAADTTAFPVVGGPSVDATVTDDPGPFRSLSADLRLDPVT